MLRRHTIFLALILAATIGQADRLSAQDEPRDGQSQREGRRGFRGDRPGGQGGDAERGGGRRGGGPGGRGFRGRGPDMNAFYERVTKELGLDEDQQAQLEEIRAAQRERMESFRQRWEAVREAEQSGDQARADQLREEMRSDFEQNMGRRRGFMEETVDSIDGILTDEQRTQFTTLRETMRNEREQEMQQRFEQRYDRIAEDLGLDDEQREVLNDIKATQMEQMREFRNRWDAVRQAYDDGDEALGDQLREEMVTEMRESGGPRQFMNRVWDELDPVLTDDQRALAQDLREERGRRRGNRDRRPPSEEGENQAVVEGGMQPENGAEPTDGGNARTQKRAADGGDDLQESLELNEEQATNYAAIQKAHKAQTAEITTKITQLETQIATAEREGDDDAVERLTAELAAEQEK
ncbi:MAG: Spy/CpxP family protein refolding chaperone, partial [Phycisphaerales bacterium]|nr:Spy/CpxP family protein refolding chaperone [Phycisphaerales bacterium]